MRKHTEMRRELWLAMLSLMACEGELPEHADPSKLLSATVSCDYHLSSFRNALIVNMAVKNIFDETLDGTAQLSGTVEIRLNRATQYQKTFRFTDAELVTARSYNSATKHLTIDPGEDIGFQVIWDFVDDNGVDLPQAVFILRPDPVCNYPLLRHIGREEFTISGTVSVFPRISSVNINPTVYSLCYADKYFIVGHECPPFQCP